MSKSPKKLHQTSLAKRTASNKSAPAGFDDVLALIEATRTRALLSKSMGMAEL